MPRRSTLTFRRELKQEAGSKIAGACHGFACPDDVVVEEGRPFIVGRSASSRFTPGHTDGTFRITVWTTVFPPATALLSKVVAERIFKRIPNTLYRSVT